MDENLRQILLASDRPDWYTENVAYNGEGIDIGDAFRRAGLVRKDLVKEFRRYFVTDDGVQDAFYWGEVSDLFSDNSTIYRPIVIRFSYCGDLASTWTIDGFRPLLEEEKNKIKSLLHRHGFNWVDGDLLRATTYDGVYDYFKDWHYNAPATWWDRFFEYD